MGWRNNQKLLFLLCLLCSGTLAQEPIHRLSDLTKTSNEAYKSKKPSVFAENKNKRVLISSTELDSSPKNEKDVVTPITTVPVINPSTPSNPTTSTPIYNPFPTPSNPTTPTMTPTYTTPAMVTPSQSGQSWCVASPTAAPTALQVALDYACGYGGADCSAIQPGGTCFNPDTVRDHASYAFNSYYQKNPVATSCDFGGTAVLTNIDPSTSACQYPSTSTSSSVLNATNTTGSNVFGSVPPYDSSDSTSVRSKIMLLIALMCLQVLLVSRNVHD